MCVHVCTYVYMYVHVCTCMNIVTGCVSMYVHMYMYCIHLNILTSQVLTSFAMYKYKVQALFNEKI